jgi:hypothetical protein
VEAGVATVVETVDGACCLHTDCSYHFGWLPWVSQSRFRTDQIQITGRSDGRSDQVAILLSPLLSPQIPHMHASIPTHHDWLHE